MPSPCFRGNLIGFAATTDSARSKTFYVQRLGFDFIEESPFALVLQASGSMIRLQKVEEFYPAEYTVLGWQVPDLRQSVVYLATQGVAVERFDGILQDELGIWTTPIGDLVAWIKDPDGQILSLTEFY